MKKYLILAIIAIGVVAFLSNMTYEQQTIVPELRTVLADKPFEEQLSKIHLTYWNKAISVEESGYFYFVEFLIRKGAHFFGFGIIGVIFFMLYKRLNWQFASLYAIASVFVIACFDELRQRFTPGRTGIFDDVIIDTTGAITCIILIKSFIFLKNLICHNRQPIQK